MDYSKLKKDELLEEVAKRNAAGRGLGVDASSTKEDIIASLQIDDEDAANHKPAVESSLPSGSRTNVPNVPLSASMPADGEFKGRYKNKKDGEEYALVVVEDDPDGKTHKLKNTAHFWEGSEEEFSATFKQ